MITYEEYFCLINPSIYVYLEGQLVGEIEYDSQSQYVLYIDILSDDVIHKANSLTKMKEILEN